MRSLKKLLPALAGIALSGFLVSACGKDPLSVSSAPILDPAAANASAIPHAMSTADQSASAVSVTKVKGLLWATSVREAHRATARLKRSLGGSVEIPQTGFRLTVPANALPEDMTITVTAVPGRILAYEFSPHGVVFLKPLTFSQDLRKTNHAPLERQLLMGAYFDDESRLNDVLGEAMAQELFATSIVSGNRVQFKIWHFSGYMVSSF